MAVTLAEIRELKVGGYIVIDDEPCRILSIQTSKPGKHGEAKARIDAMGLFDNNKRSITYPVKHKVQIPIIDKRNAQVLAITGKEVQLMDLESYETFQMPLEDEFKDKLEPQKEVQYMVALGKKKIFRVL